MAPGAAVLRAAGGPADEGHLWARLGGRRRGGRTFGWEKSATDWRTVVDDPEIDIIDISTPNDSHAEIAMAAAAAGKAIICEKPLARDVAEAEQMVAAVKKAGS